MTRKLITPVFWSVFGVLVGVIGTNLYHGIGARREAAQAASPVATPVTEQAPLHDPPPQYGLLDIQAVPEDYSAVQRDGWKVSTWPSPADSDPAAMVDGSLETAWQSYGRQSPGMFILIDLGKAERVGCVELANASDDIDDYPRRGNVSISNDGKLWTDVLTKEFPQEREPQPDDAAVRLVFPPVTTQFLRVSLQADPFAGYRCGGWWWSVGELQLYGPQVPPTPTAS